MTIQFQALRAMGGEITKSRDYGGTLLNQLELNFEGANAAAYPPKGGTKPALYFSVTPETYRPSFLCLVSS